jgi:hypothetical protein
LEDSNSLKLLYASPTPEKRLKITSTGKRKEILLTEKQQFRHKKGN